MHSTVDASYLRLVFDRLEVRYDRVSCDNGTIAQLLTDTLGRTLWIDHHLEVSWQLAEEVVEGVVIANLYTLAIEYLA